MEEIRDVSDASVSNSLSTVKVKGEKLDLDLLCPLSILCVDTVLFVYQDFEEKMIKAYCLYMIKAYILSMVKNVCSYNSTFIW